MKDCTALQNGEESVEPVHIATKGLIGGEVQNIGVASTNDGEQNVKRGLGVGDPDVEDPDVPPDGGWGWFVVLGSTLAHMIIGGLERTGGVIYLELLNKFEASASATSWVASLSSGLRLILGPVASALCNRFSVRQVVMVGSVVMTTGCIISAFAPSLLVVHLGFGVVGGIGRALCYTPCVVIVGLYFDKRRALAVGLATAGVGIGAFLLPPLTEYLFKTYGFFGAFILLAGYVFHISICAMLFRPLGLHWKLTRKKKSGSKKIAMEYEENQTEYGTLLDSKVPDQTADSNKGYNSRVDDIPKENARWADNEQVTLRMNGPETKDEENSKTDENAEVKVKESKRSNLLDFRILTDPLFLAFCFTIGLFTLAFQIFLVFLPALAESKGLSKTEAALLLSIMGIADIVARFASGVIFDRKTVRPHRRYLYNGALLLVSVNIFLCSSVRTFPGFVTVSLAHGVLSGTYVAQKSVIIVDLLGKEKLVSSFGLAVWFQGVGSFIGPPIAGKLRDSYGNYDVAFYLAGVVTFVAGCILLFSNIYFYCKTRKAAQNGTETT